MTERGMAWRGIAVVILGLLLAALVVRSAFVDAYSAEDPGRAALIWPGHPSVVLGSGLAEVGASAAAAQPVNPATVRRLLAMSAKAPLAPEPFLVRGVEARVAGDAELALHSFLEARRRDPRSVAARYFLTEHYLETGQTQQGLTEMSALTRLVPQSLKGIAPQLAAFARLPGSVVQVKRLLRDQPQLEPWLLDELAANPADASLALSLWSGRTNPYDRSWQVRLLNSLVSAGRFEEARAAWSRFDPRARPVGELIDPRFEGKAMPPFGWTLASDAAGVAEPEAPGRLHILYYGRDDVVLASQLLMLRPGSYRLAMKVTGTSSSAKSLSWVVRCLTPSREIASIGLAAAKGNELSAEFTIPPQNCVAQQLELTGAAPDVPEQADLTIAEIALSRRGQ